MENKFKRLDDMDNGDNHIELNPKFKGLIENNLSGSSHDRVVHYLTEAFDSDFLVRQNSYDKIASTGRLALPTLYGILLDEEVCTYIAAKSMGIKRKSIEEALKNNEMQDKIKVRSNCLKMISATLISKIIRNLEYEEKDRAVEVFKHVLTKEKNQEVIHSILVALEKTDDAIITIVPLLNEIVKNKNYIQKNRSQAILLLAKATEFSKNSANLLINILSKENEDLDIVKSAINSLIDSADSLTKDQISEIVRSLTSNQRFIDDVDFRNRSIELFSSCGSKVLDYLVPLISDKNRKIEVREGACFACFGVAKKDYNLEPYVLDTFVKLIEELKPNIQSNNLDDDYKIYNLLVELAKKLSY